MTDDGLTQLITALYERHHRQLYRLCYLQLCNKGDAEDAVQDTFLRFIRSPREFESPEHERAWFLRVAVNVCRDRQRFRRRHRTVELSDFNQHAMEHADVGILGEILALSDKCKAPLYLHYVEGYSVAEIAELLGSNQSTVKSWMRRGRLKLRLEWTEG